MSNPLSNDPAQFSSKIMFDYYKEINELQHEQTDIQTKVNRILEQRNQQIVEYEKEYEKQS